MFNTNNFPTLKNFTVLAWNIRSLAANETDLNFLINNHNPSIILLSETWLDNHKTVKFPGYNCYRQDRSDGYGGLVSLVKTKFKSVHINLDITPLLNNHIEVQLFKLILDHIGEVYFVNMYIHPTKSKFNFDNLNNFFALNNLSDKTIFWAGDFNSKHQLWGYNVSDRRGDSIVELAQNLSLFNINSLHPQPTRITPPNQGPSFTDLAFVSENLGQFTEWNPIRTGGSDHLPCLFYFNKSDAPCENDSSTVFEEKHKLRDWSYFRKMLDSLLTAPSYDYNEYLLLVQLAYQKSVQKEKNDLLLHSTHFDHHSKPYLAKSKRFKKIPWWDKECQSLKNKRDTLARLYKNDCSMTTFLEYKKTCAEFKLLVKKNKKNHWRSFMDSLNHNTPARVIFEKVRILNRALTPFPNVNEDWVESFLNNLTPDSQFTPQWSDPTSFSHDFQKFSEEEFQLAIQKLKKKSPGLDNTPYQFITEASPKALKYLLDIYNNILVTKSIPEPWKNIKIFTLLKKDLNPGVATSYRPIGIISVFRKLFERIIFHRIEYQLESQGSLSPFQHGFRKGRSIHGNLFQIASNAYKAIGEKLYMPAIFLDIKNAYNNVNYHILYDKMLDLGINQNLAKIIFNLISNNKIFISFNRKIWGPRLLAVGLTQGGILSPILYLIYSAHLHKCLIYASISEFADDIVIYLLNKDLELALEKILSDLDRLKEALKTLGLDLSIPKIQATIFTNRRIPNNLTLKIGDHEVYISITVRYLGLFFDRKMKWTHHVNYIKQRVISKLNILSYLSGAAWGMNQTITRRLYLNMIRPIIDFGIAIYGKNDHILDLTNKIQNICIRKVLSVLLSTPTNNLNAEAVIPPIAYRHSYLSDKLFIKAMSINSNTVIENVQMLTLSVQNSPFWSNRQYPLFLYRWLKLEQFNTKVLKTDLPRTLIKNPKFHLFIPKVSFMNIKNKKEIDSIQIQNEFLSLVHQEFRNYSLCFTDGSKTSDYTTAVFHTNNFFKIFKLDNLNTIFDAEAYAILQSVIYFINNNLSNILICSDSLSVLSNLIGTTPDLHPTVENLKQKLFDRADLNIRLLWIPSHSGIAGNEKADSLTKYVNLAHRVDNPIYYKQLIPLSKKNCLNDWNEEWTNCVWKGQKLKLLLPSIPKNPWFHKLPWSRLDIKNLIRLRIGHGLFPTHLKRINLKDTNLCSCGLEGDLNHILFQCTNLKNRDILFTLLIKNNLYPPFNIPYVLVGQDLFVYKVIAEFLSSNSITL